MVKKRKALMLRAGMSNKRMHKQR